MKIIYLSDQEIDVIVGGVERAALGLFRNLLNVRGLNLGYDYGQVKRNKHLNKRRFTRFLSDDDLVRGY